jgi:hypothetical protein
MAFSDILKELADKHGIDFLDTITEEIGGSLDFSFGLPGLIQYQFRFELGLESYNSDLEESSRGLNQTDDMHTRIANKVKEYIEMPLTDVPMFLGGSFGYISKIRLERGI